MPAASSFLAFFPEITKPVPTNTDAQTHVDFAKGQLDQYYKNIDQVVSMELASMTLDFYALAYDPSRSHEIPFDKEKAVKKLRVITAKLWIKLERSFKKFLASPSCHYSNLMSKYEAGQLHEIIEKPEAFVAEMKKWTATTIHRERVMQNVERAIRRIAGLRFPNRSALSIKRQCSVGRTLLMKVVRVSPRHHYY
jgi:hypothetical protein